MDRKKLTRELDLYIKQNYRPEGFKLKDFIGVRSVGSTIGTPIGGAKWALSFLLDKLEMTFSEKLMKLIEKKGRKPGEVYTKAGVTKAHFSKIKADKDYHPTKETALAFVIALHLDLDEAADLLKRAGYTFSHSSESDIINVIKLRILKHRFTIWLRKKPLFFLTFRKKDLTIRQFRAA
ncbi:MAG TPA: Appr-1-p processing protein [Selenomonas sp.]|nr:Appr-1-p processing protein [Selenomonas sp.]